MRALFLLPALALAGAACSEGRAGHGGSRGPELAAAATDEVAFQTVGAFALRDQRGLEVSAADLRGRPWVLGTLFTSCSTVCPRLMSAMVDAAGALEDTDVRFVAISVDPEFDSPRVLADFAERYGATGERWHLLTGDEAAIFRLLRESFWLPAARATGADVTPGQRVTHDARLVAVDREGRVRGWYDSGSEEELAKLLARMRFLAREPAAEAGP